MAPSTWITSQPPALVLILIALPLVLVTLAGIVLRSRLAPYRTLSRDLQVTGTLFECMAMLYSVLLAFVVIGLWGDYNRAKVVAEQETAHVLGVARMIHAYPRSGPELLTMRQALAGYADAVLYREYPAMARRQRSEETSRALDRLWDAACAISPRSPQEGDIHKAILDELAGAQEMRMSRLAAADGGLPTVLWMVILCFTAITLGFSVFLATEGLTFEFLITGAFALGVALMLFAVTQLNHPFVGAVSVTGEGLEAVRQVLGPVTAPGTRHHP